MQRTTTRPAVPVLAPGAHDTTRHWHPMSETSRVVCVGELARSELDGKDHPDDEHDSPAGSAHGAWLRSADRHFPSARAWDNALSASLCTALESDARMINASPQLPSTFWVDAANMATPSCSLERFACNVLQFHTTGGGVHESTGTVTPEDGSAIRGVEWWVQVRSSESPKPSINLHFDADEATKRQTCEHLPPFLSTVTYLGSHGGPTVLLPAVGDAHGRALPPISDHGAFISHPVRLQQTQSRAQSRAARAFQIRSRALACTLADASVLPCDATRACAFADRRKAPCLRRPPPPWRSARPRPPLSLAVHSSVATGQHLASPSPTRCVSSTSRLCRRAVQFA